MSTPKLIIALDFDVLDQALQLVEQLNPDKCALKVGLQMYARYGSAFVKNLIAKQFNVFLDLKFHDIPSTVAKACIACAELGVWMLNVHAAGGTEMLTAAKNAVASFGSKAPLLIAVTVLTSMAEKDFKQLGYSYSLEAQVQHFAALVMQSGLDGIVCSPWEAARIKSKFKDKLLTVTPGIRFSDTIIDDQTRIMTPEGAINAGSDFIVVGRPITQAENPCEVVDAILAVIG